MYINKTQKCTTVLQVVVLESVDVVRRGKYDALCVQKEIIMAWSTSMIVV